MNINDSIQMKLDSQLQPTLLEVIDESERHHGHAGWSEGGESHFRVVIRSPQLAVLSRLERHRLIHALLKDEIARGIHALAIDAC